MKSLLAQAVPLAFPEFQLDVLNTDPESGKHFPAFAEKLVEHGLYPLKPTGIKVFQVNVGKMCNQVCRHCHVDAGPDRKEIMTRETMQLCLDALASSDIETV